MDIHKPCFQSSTFARLNVKTLIADPATIGSRFVPFATLTGTPRNMRSGNVIAEPLPAMVLIKPDAQPATIKTIALESPLMHLRNSFFIRVFLPIGTVSGKSFFSVHYSRVMNDEQIFLMLLPCQ
jgi:hypothetical protein